MKIGDKKEHQIVQFTGCQKIDVLACFKQLVEQEQEKRLLELMQRQREIRERNKKLF